jgi:ribosomal protein S18 acetylase RimI-like enzyme
MLGGNFERMIALVDEFFAAKNDPEQISVTPADREKLGRIHPSTMSEQADENGPIAWVLVIPTTRQVMVEFVEKKISESRLLQETPVGGKYDALYLCSALVLPEHQRRGIARRLTVDAARAIRRDHPIESLFYWSFSSGGSALARAVARELGMPLLERSS